MRKLLLTASIVIVSITMFSGCEFFDKEEDPKPENKPAAQKPAPPEKENQEKTEATLEKESVSDDDAWTLNFGWVKTLATMGHARAQFFMGYFYERGIFVDQNWCKAYEWYQKSANQGDRVGQYNVGLCYYYGYGCTQDTQTAKVWLQKSAAQEYTKARLFLLENEF